MREIKIDTGSGLVGGARQVSSPNCDQRPPGMAPDLIVIHGISLPPGEFGGPWIDRLFTNSLPAGRHPYLDDSRSLRVSAHLLIRRSGELVQYVPLHKRAWHAGESCFGDRECCNDFSIGIELEGTDEETYEAAQYECLAAVVLALASAYPSLSAERIVGHSDISPARKTDPGPAFDWARLRAMLGSGSREPETEA